MATKRPRLDAEDDPGPNSQRQSDDVKMWLHDAQQTLTKT
ncbi:hypothetical protein PPTG_21969 [Phytophthora nicotianae INRA-310]|uniref:Uncharacterized protein n=1 Tax=Phytophthora nicotianae (strain INRA-310) TaxID=761204 RepID=W2QQW7_PHYN3|nr:hypothetical protein PPTG_21969 [Phytophthora nicotianae INRA-310]ETN15597.1 hypothetical protein PPTG_21969 [Phytophthora nicotianae INRA-310]